MKGWKEKYFCLSGILIFKTFSFIKFSIFHFYSVLTIHTVNWNVLISDRRHFMKCTFCCENFSENGEFYGGKKTWSMNKIAQEPDSMIEKLEQWIYYSTFTLSMLTHVFSSLIFFHSSFVWTFVNICLYLFTTHKHSQ